ncbi:MAG: hypothetical protein JXB29_03485 [Sedimentisphaerales bacterium]|nr:hypothetical protein [Sedimentisphaerales bacterium]
MLAFQQQQSQEETIDNTGAPDNLKEQQYLTVSAKGKDVRKSTWLLAVLFFLGLLTVGYMIKKSTPQAASASEMKQKDSKIEFAISQLTGISSEILKRMDKIVKKFYEFSDVRQIQVNELVKNPFETEKFLFGLGENSDTHQGSFSDNRQMQEKPEQLIQLLSIMRSYNASCCMIDDKILYVGDSIRGFKVVEIGDGFVKLELDSTSADAQTMALVQQKGSKIVLKLSD